jgi:hypothetical protein
MTIRDFLVEWFRDFVVCFVLFWFVLFCSEELLEEDIAFG